MLRDCWHSLLRASSWSEVAAALWRATRCQIARPLSREQVHSRSLPQCVLCIFSALSALRGPGMCAVCSSYLVGCVMCGSVAKGSGNVQFFQHNHTSPATTLLCPRLSPPVARMPPAWELLEPARCGGQVLRPRPPVSIACSSGFFRMGGV